VPIRSVAGARDTAGLLVKWKGKPSKERTGSAAVTSPRALALDISYINISGTFYYLCSVLDGYKPLLVHWDLAASR